MGRRRILLAVVSAAALWRATAMDHGESIAAADPAANPFDGTGHMSAGQLFYGDERDGRRSFAQRNYDWYTGPEGPGLEAYTDVIREFTQQMLSIEHWKDLRDRLIATLSRDVSLGAMTIRRELKDIWVKYKSKDYIPTNGMQNTVSALGRAGVVMKKKFAPGPLCKKVGAQPAYVSLALVASGLVAHFSGLITLNLGEMFAAACHWGFFFLMAVRSWVTTMVAKASFTSRLCKAFMAFPRSPLIASLSAYFQSGSCLIWFCKRFAWPSATP